MDSDKDSKISLSDRQTLYLQAFKPDICHGSVAVGGVDVGGGG